MSQGLPSVFFVARVPAFAGMTIICRPLPHSVTPTKVGVQLLNAKTGKLGRNIVMAGLDPAISGQRQIRGSSPRMTYYKIVMAGLDPAILSRTHLIVDNIPSME